MKIEGQIHRISDTVQVSEKFQKREFVLKFADNPMYPQYVSFQLVQDKVTLIDSYLPGDSVEVEFNLHGREWTSPQGEVKYFNTLQAWRLTHVEREAVTAVEPDDLFEPQEGEDDLPF